MAEGFRVPYFGPAREFAACRQDMMLLLEAVLDSGSLLQGKEVRLFEEELAACCGRDHAVAVGSCTDALFFSLAAAGVAAGDEVLVPDFSFVASASCILRAGAIPVFCDVDAWGNMDLAAARKLVGPRTKAMVYVHLYGRMSDPAAVEGFCNEHGLALIEDAAQAIGAEHGARRAGSMGLASCISFDPTKPLTCLGSGGAVATDDPELARRIQALRYHGRDPERQFSSLGYNSQMPTASAALLRYKLGRDRQWGDRRREIAARYCGALGPLGLAVPLEEAGTRHIYHKFVVQTPRREALLKHLKQNGVEAMVHYPTPLHAHPLFRDVLPEGGVENPGAAALARTVLSLPMHPHLSMDEVDFVLEQVSSFFG